MLVRLKKRLDLPDQKSTQGQTWLYLPQSSALLILSSCCGSQRWSEQSFLPSLRNTPQLLSRTNSRVHIPAVLQYWWNISREPCSALKFSFQGGGLCGRRQIPNWTLGMQACWPCIWNRIHPAIDYFVFSGAHPRSVNIRGLHQNMKLAFSPHPLHASALLFMSRCECMCVNVLAQDGWGYREMSKRLWRQYYVEKKKQANRRCCIDAHCIFFWKINGCYQMSV